MPSKYHNRAVKLDGYTFDSQAEARRYQELRLAEQAGAIRDLQVHHRWRLVPKIDGHGWHVYEADFTYVENGRLVVEDVKGARTQLSMLKLAVFHFCYPQVEIRLVEV